MSIKTDQLVKEMGFSMRDMQTTINTLTSRIEALERNIIEGEIVSHETTELVAAYELKFGRPPHHRMKPETIAQALR
tara:strand:+ start:580 stop:810 length:231 start_codon:yes stop_codon:yes gene_type:complete